MLVFNPEPTLKQVKSILDTSFGIKVSSFEDNLFKFAKSILWLLGLQL